MLSEVPACAVCVAKSSKSGRGIEERKLMYAGEYRPCWRSCVIRSRFAAVGSTRYRTGTSGIGCRCPLMFLILPDQQVLLASQHRQWLLVMINLQVYSDAPASKIIDAKDATDHISSQIVENQHFPYRLAIGV